ncbi:hypothetical protein NKJ71_09540 [Mesorhizobium sp. M0050]|uniref:hypothetical protein n=1 Tax=Mesorhizobium sp. M0050 TaxID=2956861 RepID=UPI00333CDDA8
MTGRPEPAPRIITQLDLLNFLEIYLDEGETRIVVSENTREIFDLIKGACEEDDGAIALDHLDVVRALIDCIGDDTKVITSHRMLAFIFKFLGMHSESTVDALTAIEMMVDHAFPGGWVGVMSDNVKTRISTTREGKRALGRVIDVIIPRPRRYPPDPFVCEIFFDWPGAFKRLWILTPAEVAKRRAAQIAATIEKSEGVYGPPMGRNSTHHEQDEDYLTEDDF